MTHVRIVNESQRTGALPCGKLTDKKDKRVSFMNLTALKYSSESVLFTKVLFFHSMNFEISGFSSVFRTEEGRIQPM